VSRRKAEIVIVNSDEGWTGMYLNGNLVYEGHSLPADRAVDIVLWALDEGASGDRYLDGAANAWLCDVGTLPSTLAELDEKIRECADLDHSSSS
jgi:hypothetical protein